MSGGGLADSGWWYVELDCGFLKPMEQERTEIFERMAASDTARFTYEWPIGHPTPWRYAVDLWLGKQINIDTKKVREVVRVDDPPKRSALLQK